MKIIIILAILFSSPAFAQEYEVIIPPSILPTVIIIDDGYDDSDDYESESLVETPVFGEPYAPVFSSDSEGE